jgi:hypothetical protein
MNRFTEEMKWNVKIARKKTDVTGRIISKFKYEAKGPNLATLQAQRFLGPYMCL